MGWIKDFFKKKELKVQTTEFDSKAKSEEALTKIDTTGFDYEYLGINFDIKTSDLFNSIRTWRNVSKIADVDDILDDIINEAIVHDEKGQILRLNLEDTEFSDNIKKKIYEEFDYILNLLNFNKNAYEYFYKWYVDGRIITQNVFFSNNKKAGIQKIKMMSPFDIVPVEYEGEIWYLYKKYEKDYNVFNNRVDILSNAKKLKQISEFNTESIYLIPKLLINYINSIIYDDDKKFYISPLHRALKRVNQLQLLEDHILVYRIVRAPEKRIFYVDVGKMTNSAAEQYLKKLAKKFSKDYIYDPTTGEINTKKSISNMIENLWFARRDGKTTEVTTLDGAQNLGELDDLEYFEKKFYTALKVPIGRKRKEDNTYMMGRSGEITREEIKFAKYIARLRSKFSEFLLEPLKKHLVVSGIITEGEWEKNESNINVLFNNDNLYETLKELDVLNEKLSTISNMVDYEGKYFTRKDIHRILGRNEEDIKEFDKQVEQEIKDGYYKDPNAEEDNGY